MIDGIASLISVDCPRLTLGDLIAIDGIVEEEREIGYEVEIVFREEQLIFKHAAVVMHFDMRHPGVSTGSFATFSWIYSTEPGNESVSHCAFRYLARSIPSAVER